MSSGTGSEGAAPVPNARPRPCPQLSRVNAQGLMFSRLHESEMPLVLMDFLVS